MSEGTFCRVEVHIIVQTNQSIQSKITYKWDSAESLATFVNLYHYLYGGVGRLISVFETTAKLKFSNMKCFPLAPFARFIGSLLFGIF